jgi:hypothetical protein
MKVLAFIANICNKTQKNKLIDSCWRTISTEICGSKTKKKKPKAAPINKHSTKKTPHDAQEIPSTKHIPDNNQTKHSLSKPKPINRNTLCSQMKRASVS